MAGTIPNTSYLSMAVGPDGSLYILSLALVQRVAPDRSVTAFAGTGTLGFSGDGGPAAPAMI